MLFVIGIIILIGLAILIYNNQKEVINMDKNKMILTTTTFAALSLVKKRG